MRDNLPVLQWLLSKDSLYDFALLEAVRGSQMYIVTWLLEKGVQKDTIGVFTVALQEGNLEMVKYLKDNGFPWAKWVEYFNDQDLDYETL